MQSAAGCPQFAALQTIMELELYAAFATVHAHLTTHPTLTNIVLHVDSVAACFALVKGRTRNPRSGKIVTAYQSLLDRARAGVYVLYVNTDGNPADACCRLASFHDLCVLRGPFVELPADHSRLLYSSARIFPAAPSRREEAPTLTRRYHAIDPPVTQALLQVCSRRFPMSPLRGTNRTLASPRFFIAPRPEPPRAPLGTA